MRDQPTPARNAWEALVRRYADGRLICNCGDAYAEPHGEPRSGWNGRLWQPATCRHGCSANQLAAREDIARRVLKEINYVR